MHTGIRHHQGHPLAWLYNVVGWVSVAAIIAAYFLLSFSYIQSHDLVYILLNVFASLGIIMSSLPKKDYQPVVLNFIWLAIALAGLVRVI